jgi:ATP-dependent DNA helicase RecQ
MSVLQTIFGYERFKGRQEEAIDAILSGSDCLIILPTGAGKILCYLIPVIIAGGLTVVISPLLSLMLDQVQHLRSKGLNMLYTLIPQWPMMTEIPSYITWYLATHPIIALTATCTARTEGVVISSLQITSPIIVRETCNRKNISQIVKEKKGDGKDQVANEIVNEHKNKCGIIYYCLQRSDTTDMAYLLQMQGINATYYHGALDPYKKKENFQAWLDGKALVICATIAFGMVIDKPDVRFVIHLSLPQSLECYAQQFGRAGRDGEDHVYFSVLRTVQDTCI